MTGSSPRVGAPSTKIAPLSGVTIRLNDRRSVVFPDPLSPISATHSPGATSRLTWSRATTGPYRFETLAARSAAAGSADGCGVRSVREACRGARRDHVRNLEVVRRRAVALEVERGECACRVEIRTRNDIVAEPRRPVQRDRLQVARDAGDGRIAQPVVSGPDEQ